MRLPRGNGGTSLVEMLVGVAIAGVFSGGAHLFLASVLESARVLEVAGEAEESARVGIHLIERDLRGAGYGSPDALRPGLQLASRTQVRIASDLNGDGDTADTNEVVGYGLDAARHLLTRSQGSAAPQPMIEGVADDGLVFTYFDAAGAPLSGLDTASARALVRRVDVALTIELQHPARGAARAIRVRQTASVALRND
jgi:Tfp pilus assembly protein PilW